MGSRALLDGRRRVISLTSGWRMHVDERQALVEAQQAVGFPVGHASAQQVWRGLRSRPTWRVLCYSVEDPPSRAAASCSCDAVDGEVVEHLVEDNPERWSAAPPGTGAGEADVRIAIGTDEITPVTAAVEAHLDRGRPRASSTPATARRGPTCGRAVGEAVAGGRRRPRDRVVLDGHRRVDRRQQGRRRPGRLCAPTPRPPAAPGAGTTPTCWPCGLRLTSEALGRRDRRRLPGDRPRRHRDRRTSPASPDRPRRRPSVSCRPSTWSRSGTRRWSTRRRHSDGLTAQSSCRRRPWRRSGAARRRRRGPLRAASRAWRRPSRRRRRLRSPPPRPSASPRRPERRGGRGDVALRARPRAAPTAAGSASPIASRWRRASDRNVTARSAGVEALMVHP